MKQSGKSLDTSEVPDFFLTVKYLFIWQLPKSRQSGGGAHQRQGKSQEGNKTEKIEKGKESRHRE